MGHTNGMKTSPMRPLLVELAVVVTWMFVAEAAPVMAAPEAVPGFNREIRPILSDRCFFCHGPDKAKRKSGLRLDDRAAAIEAGALVPGKPDESDMFKRIITS